MLHTVTTIVLQVQRAGHSGTLPCSLSARAATHTGRIEYFRRANAKTPALSGGGFWLEGSLTITYFHTGIRTIIGVESFHG
ncbi:hypothetical protein, partial [Burkholderia orbicola]|uniref:hypothetical protein n=1 Tax=Burkholderia orbicola TaxID=2978683 RepID=UPI002FE05E9F